MIVHSVETIIAVLSSSVQCKVLRVGEEETLQVGGSISRPDCGELCNACVEILDRLGGHGGNFIHLLACDPMSVYLMMISCIPMRHNLFLPVYHTPGSGKWNFRTY